MEIDRETLAGIFENDRTASPELRARQLLLYWRLGHFWQKLSR